MNLGIKDITNLHKKNGAFLVMADFNFSLLKRLGSNLFCFQNLKKKNYNIEKLIC